jgi:hypothetical protein
LFPSNNNLKRTATCEVMMMICPGCKSEMSKRWQAKSADEPTKASGMVWSCGVCGRQTTLADMKSYSQTEHSVKHEPASSVLTLPRRVAAPAWAPTDEKRIRG